ncbi:hypothetical protein C2S52_020675 [Perilla frutescens var. hirtella]|nr:hypothetical protein C2S52_020675 [Perilla frutescens var. hirtella]
MGVLEEFEAISRLHINKHKSELFTTGLQCRELDEIYDAVGFQYGVWPIKYLGVSLDTETLQVVHYNPLIDKIGKHINKWASKTFSYVGRVVLIQSVLQGVSCYWLQIFPLPEACTSKITRLSREFLWGSKIAPIA